MGRTPGPTSITVTVADAQGGPDLEIRFDPTADLTAGDLVAAWPSPPPDGLVVDGRSLADDTPLGACGLADGATVGCVPPPHPQLIVVAGPLPQVATALDGPLLVGRGIACGLRLDHPSVAPAHALVAPERDGWSACALDGACRLDARPLHGPRPLAEGSVLSVGAIDLQVLGPAASVVVPPPRAPVHRAARPPDVDLPDPGPPPAPPDPRPPPSPPGALTLALPLVVGAVLAVAVHPTAGLVTAGMPVLAVGAHLDARRRHRRDRRRAEADHVAAVDDHRRIADEAARQAADRQRQEHPTAVDAVHRACGGVRLWPVRGPEADRLAVGWSDDALQAPVIVDLGAGGLGIAGPRRWAAAVERALVVQAVTRAGPRDRSVPDAPGFARWLPHGRSTGPPLVLEVAERPGLLSDRCTATLVWAPDGARLSDRGDGRRDLPVRPFLADEPTAERFARACARWSDPSPESAALPDQVGLAELDLDSGHDGRLALAAPLGLGTDGPVVVDLVAHGPHALVAGTTGSGKSELLRTWVTALAARHPPTAVAFVLVDYKGGSAFDTCARLPHVTGVVTDLDPGLAERLLVSLRAEVRDREVDLRRAGVPDLRDLPDGPPRLVVVVDEFATLAAELPDFLGALVDVARRGRSLGVHLVLATQRPAGAVNDDIRANTALRLCLRTLDAADSQDVLGGPEAATLPADIPGRAWLRRGGKPELVQVAGGTRAVDGPPLAVRRVDTPWPSYSEGPAELEVLVDEITAAWADRPRPPPAWLSPLPDRLGPLAGDGDPVVLGRRDRPAARSQPPLTWDPADGHLVLVGGRRSGRSTLLANAVLGLARIHPATDLHVHVLDGGRDLAPLADLPHVGAWVPAHDRATANRLVARLDSADGDARTVLVVDGYDALVATVDDVDGVRLLDALDGLARSGVVLAVSSARPTRLPPSVLAHSAVTVALRLDDPAHFGVLGLRPPARPGPPGRGWTVDGDEVQLVAPPEPDLASAVAAVGARAEPVTPGAGPPSIGPLPRLVPRSGLEPTPGSATIGLRDRDLRTAVATLRPGTPFVVTGPPRSGRSTTLDLLVGQLPDGPTSVHRQGEDPTGFLADVAAWLDRPSKWTFAVDDAEGLADPDGRLQRLVTLRHPDAVVLVSLRTDAWRSTYGTWLAELRPAAAGIALGLDPVRDAELWAAPLPRPEPDPPPGRGALVLDGRAELVQVAVDG